jgi:hypothetical protein
MKTVTKVKNLTVNITLQNEMVNTDDNELLNDSKKMEKLVITLRNIASDKFYENKIVVFPDGCEKEGFTKGDFSVPNLLYYLADMLEE